MQHTCSELKHSRKRVCSLIAIELTAHLQFTMAPSNQSAGPFTAVVTGASGFVSGETIKQLLSKGWNVRRAICTGLDICHVCVAHVAYYLGCGLQVRGTVRSLSNKDKTQHLTKLSEVGLLGLALI